MGTSGRKAGSNNQASLLDQDPKLAASFFRKLARRGYEIVKRMVKMKALTDNMSTELWDNKEKGIISFLAECQANGLDEEHEDDYY